MDVLERQEISRFLEEHPLGILATLDERGAPELSAVYFYRESGFALSIVTKASTRKFRNMLRDSRAALSVVDEEALATIELKGILRPVEDTIDVVRALEHLEATTARRKDHYEMPPIAQIKAGQYAVLKLVPEEVRYSCFSHGGEDPYTPKRMILRFA